MRLCAIRLCPVQHYCLMGHPSSSQRTSTVWTPETSRASRLPRSRRRRRMCWTRSVSTYYVKFEVTVLQMGLMIYMRLTQPYSNTVSRSLGSDLSFAKRPPRLPSSLYLRYQRKRRKQNVRSYTGRHDRCAIRI